MAENGRSPTQKKNFGQGLLDWVNLRPEEGQRTFWMFIFYTATSVGVLWLEVGISALFLNEYGADQLPWIYIVSAGIGTLLGFFYSLLQKFLPLRWVIVLVAVLMGLPLLLLRIGLSLPLMVGYSVFLLRLWMEAIYVLSELNTSITANQLFNIREIKRTYPLISSGILMADVVSGLSLPVLRSLVGLENVIFMAGIMLLVGAGILFYISRKYHQFFPDSPRRRLQEEQPDFTTRRLRGPIQRYVILLVLFFVIAQIMLLVVDLQYLAQIEAHLVVDADQDVGKIADFLALFSAVLGTFELLVQWFLSSRLVERLGVFIVVMIPPALLLGFGLLTLSGVLTLFWGFIVLKFIDELLRYTILAATGPVLFQPIPDTVRSWIQSIVRGIAEPLSIGLTGVGMLITFWFCRQVFWGDPETAHVFESQVFLLQIIVFCIIWLVTVWQLRSRYVNLLVLTVERGDLSLSEADLGTFRRAIADALGHGTDEDKKACIELLTHIDPRTVGDVLAPLLPTFSPPLQQLSLEAMTEYPSFSHLGAVRDLLQQPLVPNVMAGALRYVWLTDDHPNINELRDYLSPQVDAEVRGTAAALMLRRGNAQQRAEATETLRRMLTHQRERERMMGCRALGEANYLQALRIYVEALLKDESLRVRCALLEAIAATHTEEYYPSLLRGLYYKSTRDAAMGALVRLGDEAIPLLVTLGENPYESELVRSYAWRTLGAIASHEAMTALVSRLMTAWGNTRRTILRTLLKAPHEAGIEAVEDILGRTGIEKLIDQELAFIGQINASLIDLSGEAVVGKAADLMRRALNDLQRDSHQRIFLLLRFLYPSSAIQAAAFNLQNASWDQVARGLEILDNTVDLECKWILLTIFDQRSQMEKLESLSEFFVYEPLLPNQRLRYLLDLRHFLSDWSLACCFHLARESYWSLNPDQVIATLNHPTGYVREAAIAYLRAASPRTLRDLLPTLQDDPNKLVSMQVAQLMQELGLGSLPRRTQPSNGKVFRPSPPSLDVER